MIKKELTQWKSIFLETLLLRSRNSLFLWKPQTHHRVHKSHYFAPVQSQLNPFHVLTPYFSDSF
jgi:hypothetical protein